MITKSTLEKFKTGTRRSKSLIKLRPVHGRLGNLEVGKENQFLKLDTVHLAELLVHENYNYAFFFRYTFSIFSVFFSFFCTRSIGPSQSCGQPKAVLVVVRFMLHKVTKLHRKILSGSSTQFI